MNIQITDSGAAECLTTLRDGRACIIRAAHYGIGLIAVSATVQLKTKWKMTSSSMVKGHDPEVALREFLASIA